MRMRVEVAGEGEGGALFPLLNLLHASHLSFREPLLPPYAGRWGWLVGYLAFNSYFTGAVKAKWRRGVGSYP